jgi:hypothetical protein
MAAAPLTHHDIVALAAPFTRQGRHVDLAASDRMARRLLFKPQRLQALLPPLTETLLLDETEQGQLRLARALVDDQGLRASIHAEGAPAEDLLQRVLAVPPEQQFSRGTGWAIGWGLRLRGNQVQLAHAELRLDGLTLQMSVSGVDRIPAVIDIRASAGDIPELPQDLLAVLGRAWSRLDRSGAGWRCSLDLRGRGAARSAQAQAQLQRAAEHLARTLAEPPQRFHDQRVARRWAVTARRTVPLLVCLGLIAAALAVPALDLAPDSVFRMLIFNAPPILLGLFVVLREMPRIEIPPLPRRPAAPTWRRAPPAATTETA